MASGSSRFPLARGAAWCVAAWLLLGASAAGAAEGSPRLQYLTGSVASAPRGDPEWTDVRTGHPLRPGDRLWADPGARVEIVDTGLALRLAGASHLTLDRDAPGRVQWSLRQGSLIARIAPPTAGEDVEIDTPNLAFRPTVAGLYRLDVDRTAGTTRIQVLEGAGIVYGEQGQSVPVRAGHRLFRGRGLAGDSAASPAPAPDAFERWAVGRDRLQSAPGPAPVGAAAAPRKSQQEAQRRREREQARQREAWARQQRALAERWRREQEDWLRYQHGLPPAHRGTSTGRLG